MSSASGEKYRASSRGRAALMAADPTLAAAMAQVGPYTLDITPLTSVYEALARSIVYQQLTGKAAGTIWQRLLQLSDGSMPPTPAQVAASSDETLRGVGLSRNKVLALRDLAARDAAGRLPDVEAAATMDDQRLIDQLSAVRGIGVWSVQMLLMFRLGRRDVVPTTDLGIQKGFQRAFRTPELPTPKEVAARAERWRPHRSMASWYLWRMTEQP